MLKYSLDELRKKIIGVIKKYSKTKIIEQQRIIILLNTQYRLKYNFWTDLLKHKQILNAVISNILIGRTIIKTLDYYFQNMSKSKTGDEVKERAILEFVAIAYRTVAPRLNNVPVLFRISLNK